MGDSHGLAVLKLQPTKLAAIEANWETNANMPLLLFAIPDQKAEKNHYEIGIPKLGSFILTHDFSGVVPGLKDVPPDQRPPVWPVFYAFRIMVAIGMAMLALSLWSLYLRWRGTLYSNRFFLTCAMLMTPSGFGAVLFGWLSPGKLRRLSIAVLLDGKIGAGEQKSLKDVFAAAAGLDLARGGRGDKMELMPMTFDGSPSMRSTNQPPRPSRVNPPATASGSPEAM